MVERSVAGKPLMTGGDKDVSSGKGNADISVLQIGNRLQITADVDASGLATLTEMIAKYQEILKLLNS